jgi:putative toxin-antitoxin system antitoxin component (TIGR02293 family)
MGKATGAAEARRQAQRGASLGLKPSATATLIRQIEVGLPFSTLASLADKSGIDIGVLAAVIGLPERALARRRLARKLTPAESERLVRLSIVFESAVKLFEGDVRAAVDWLARPRRVFDNQSALAFSRSELGGREVEGLIGQLEHGVFA